MTIQCGNDSSIKISSFGLKPFSQALILQQSKHRDVGLSLDAASILWGEHPAVLTLGKHSSRSDILASQAVLEKHGIEVIQTDRGGKVTLHNPGQLVVYPIIDLMVRRLGIRPFISILESSVIGTLGRYGIEAHTEADRPGVWVGTEKIGAVGVRVSQRISMHGLSLNVCNELGHYQFFVPCGIRDRGITSMARILGASRAPALDEIGQLLAQGIASRLTAI